MKRRARKKMSNDIIWYGDGTPKEDTGNKVSRNTRLINLISQETKDRWKQQEEDRKKPKRDLTEEELEQNFKLRKSNLKDFIVERTPEETGDIFKQQAKAHYNDILERINNGETITSKDTNFGIQELQQMLRRDGIATILTIPTRTEGYKLRKI